jgi:trehalose/maltose hydrolase-like predicted phosphorylase
MGGLWQALTLGFGGIRPRGGVLLVDPRLPPQWSGLEIPLGFHGRRLHVSVRHDSLKIRSDAPVTVSVPGAGTLEVARRGVELRPSDDGWVLATS